MDFTKLLLIGAGGYLLYQFMQGQADAPTGDATDVPANVVPTNTTVNGAATFRARVLAEATRAGETRNTMNADEWGWYYQRAYGIPGPDPDLMELPARGLLMTIDEWMGRAKPLTVVGLSGLRLVGVNTVAVATGYETLNIRDVN